MEIFTDQHGKTYQINTASPIAQGGEGIVCSIQGYPNLVAKIFNADSPALKSNSIVNKINYMAKLYDETDDKTRKIIQSQITWIQAVLKDKSGAFKGYIMQKVTGHITLQEAFSTSQNNRSNFTFKDKVQIAKNLCIAVNIMHVLGCVVGDFNAKNILVDIKKGTVYLVDTDSFHMAYDETRRGRTITRYYPTLVGRPEYLPKELHEYVNSQHATLDNVAQPSFNRESDLFALAIHIFQLLMNGTQPFGLKVNPAHRVESVSAVDVSWATNIKLGRYVYSDKPELSRIRQNFIPPDFAPPVEVLSRKLRELFDRAFVVSASDEKKLKRATGDNKYFSDPPVRPSAEEWYKALEAFEKSLVECKRASGHYYGNHLSSCPWCNRI